MSVSDSTRVAVPSVDYSPYVIPSDISIQNVRQGGRFNQSQIVTYSDGIEWVFLPNKQKERFCGFLFLQEALNQAGLTKIKAAENKMAINGKDIIYLSKYCGEKKLDLFEDFGVASSLNAIGFTDTPGNANLRKIEDVTYVFDTEKGSFAGNVHEKIDSFVHLHDAIRFTLEEQLNS